MDLQSGDHILVVEDDDAYRRSVERMLRRSGFRVTAVANFAAMMTVIEGAEPISLMLTDIGMPAGMPHGFSLSSVARRLRPGLKVVFMTGGQRPSEFSLSDGKSLVLQKPFTQQQLAAAIKTVLVA